jgi:hypothetical protein
MSTSTSLSPSRPLHGLPGQRPLAALLVCLASAAALPAQAAPIGPAPIPIPIPFGPVDLSVDRIEVTQSQQFLGNSTSADNSLPAVDRRTTTVRVYVKRTGGFPFSPVTGIQGRLRVFNGATLLYDMLSDNGPVSAGGLVIFPGTPARENAAATLNFTFLPGSSGLALFGRNLTFTATVDPFNTISEGNEANNELSLTKLFECRSAPTFVGVPINYQASTEPDATTLGLPDPNLTAQGVGDAFLWGAYPFPDYVAGASAPYRLFNGPALTWTSDIETSDITLLNDLDTMRVGMSPVPDHIYGWFRNNPFSGNGEAFIGGHAAFGNTDPLRFPRTFAHEIGHNFGFSHFRAETGLTITSIDETGWDTLDRVALGVLKSKTLQDIMVPGLLTHEAWVHPRTYQDVHDGATRACFVFPHFPIKLLTVALIPGPTPGDPWQVRPGFEVSSIATAPEPTKQGRGQLRILDQNGGTLYQTGFEVAAPGDARQEGGARGASLTVPALAGAAAIEVSYDGKVRQVVKRSPNAPRVAIAGAQVAGDALTLSWKAEDPDGDRLEALVRYSPDGGQTYIPLAVRPRGTALRLSLEGLPASAKGSLEVRVSDGFNTSAAVIEGLAIGKNRPPVVALVRPHQGDEYLAGANVVMMSSISDPEDGGIPPEQIAWTSSRDGALGTGPALNTTALTPGTHLLTVKATDSQGASSEASATITVR